MRPTDPLDEVGDEALLASSELERLAGPSGRVARVVVAPTRAAAIDFAAGAADVIVIDGVAQTAPVPATLALLAVDADEPWGRAATVPPWGDLRAPVARSPQRPTSSSQWAMSHSAHESTAP